LTRGARLLLYKFMLLKVTGKGLFVVTPFPVLLFIVYTVIITVQCYWYCSPCIRLLLIVILYCYCHCIVPVFYIIWIWLI